MLISHIASELEREWSMREFVFPRLLRDGKLNETEHADRMARLNGALQVLETLMEHGVATVEELPLRLTPGPQLNAGTKSTSTLSIIKGDE